MRQETSAAMAIRSVVHDFLLPLMQQKPIPTPRIDEADEVSHCQSGAGEFIGGAGKSIICQKRESYPRD